MQVLEHFFAKYSLESPLQKYLLQKAEALEAEKAAVRRELDPTLKLKETLDEHVSNRGLTSVLLHCHLTICIHMPYSTGDTLNTPPLRIIGTIFEADFLVIAERVYTSSVTDAWYGRG